jgi:arylsulfatase A-like enzyme
MKKQTLTIALLGLLLPLNLSCGGGETGTSESSNTPQAIVVIVLDDVRHDFFGCYGSNEGLTPNIDGLATSSVRFEWAFSQSPVAPLAVASLLTGLYPTTHGLVDPGDRLVAEAPTLAESLVAEGWTTAAFFEGAGGEPGFAQGFKTFEVVADGGESARSWLESVGGEPFFLLVNTESPEELDSYGDDETGLTAYKDHVKRLDNVVGEVISSLQDAGLENKAAVFVVGATGLELGEHGAVGSPAPYSTVTRVPLIVRPCLGSSPAVVTEIVEVLDVMPTVLELASVTEPTGVQGSSLLALVDGTARPPYIAFGESATQRYVALGGYAFVVDGESFQLFNLDEDPFQLTNIAETDAHRSEVFLEHLEAWGKMVAAASLDPERRIETVDDETLEKLRSLGYIQ